MNVIALILLVFSFVLFALATFGVSDRWNLVAAGLACWVLADLLAGAGVGMSLP